MGFYLFLFFIKLIETCCRTAYRRNTIPWGGKVKAAPFSLCHPNWWRAYLIMSGFAKGKDAGIIKKDQFSEDDVVVGLYN